MRSAFGKEDCTKYAHDFEVGNGLLRGSRIPMGKGVAMDARGIRWLVGMSGRTLLAGESIISIFTWALRLKRTAYVPLFAIGDVTISPDWTRDDYILRFLLEPQAYLNKPYEEDGQGWKFAKAANRNNAYMHMGLSHWTRKVIIPRTRNGKNARVMRICDIPGFHPHARDPSLGKCHTIANEDLPLGVWENTDRRP